MTTTCGKQTKDGGRCGHRVTSGQCAAGHPASAAPVTAGSDEVLAGVNVDPFADLPPSVPLGSRIEPDVVPLSEAAGFDVIADGRSAVWPWDEKWGTHVVPAGTTVDQPVRRLRTWPQDEVEGLVGYDLGRWPSRETVDMLLVDPDGNVLMIERGKPPFAGCDAWPGGFVDPGEDARTAALRELAEEAGLGLGDGVEIVEVGRFDTYGRDPRGPVASTAFVALVPRGVINRAAAGDDAVAARAVPFAALADVPVAFDHRRIAFEAMGIPGVAERVPAADRDAIRKASVRDALRNRRFATEVARVRNVELAGRIHAANRDIGVGQPDHEGIKATSGYRATRRNVTWNPEITGPNGNPIIVNDAVGGQWRSWEVDPPADRDAGVAKVVELLSG